MVMGQFVTTYRKDYLWPYVKTIGTKPEPDKLYQPQLRDDRLCPCHCVPKPGATNEQVNMLGPASAGEEAWSRLGPMGPLLDPKMYPAKVSSAPESKVSRYNQPNAFLKKLQEKYPFIYECLRTAPPDDLISRVNKDRLLTTYQVDFCRKQEIPSEPYDDLIRAAGMEGLSPCPEPARLPGDVCRPLEKARISQRVGGGKACGGVPKAEEAKYCVGSCKAGPLGTITPGATEYQDAVARLGTLIVREGLHEPRKTGEPGRDALRAKKCKVYTCPKPRPGPYFRPYEIQDRFSVEAKLAEEDRTARMKKTCLPVATTAQIITWKTPACDSKLIESWGQMAYRDSIHAHGGRRAKRGTLVRK